MPILEEENAPFEQTRMLLYGAPLSRKTWWATRAAEDGFNVIFCDLDGGSQITKNIPAAARRRIFHLDMRVPVDGYDNSGAHLLAHCVHGKAALYDEQLRKYVSINRAEEARAYIKLDLSKLTGDTVLIIDSWTALCAALVEAHSNVVNPTKIGKLEWDDYAAVRHVLDHFLAGLRRLNCHVIVIAHSETYAKRKPDADPKAKPNEAIEQIRLQPASVSRNHGEKLASHFTDTLFFDVPNSMVGTMIDTRGSVDFDAGSRSMAPKKYKWDEVSFADFAAPPATQADKFFSPAITDVTGEELAAAAASNKAKSTVNVGGGSTGIINRLGKGA